MEELRITTLRERASVILAELAHQALRVESDNRIWGKIAEAFPRKQPPRDSLLHWTRLAEPIPVRGVCDGKRWKLVA